MADANVLPSWKEMSIQSSLVIGILTGFLLTSCDPTGYEQGAISEASQTRVEDDISMLKTMLGFYEKEYGSLPTSDQGLKALAEKPTGENAPKNWVKLMKVVPVDPWDSEYQYLRTPENDGRSSSPYDIWSNGPDGESGTADDIGNWENGTL